MSGEKGNLLENMAPMALPGTKAPLLERYFPDPVRW